MTGFVEKITNCKEWRGNGKQYQYARIFLNFSRICHDTQKKYLSLGDIIIAGILISKENG